jgi:hypothetical protein
MALKNIEIYKRIEELTHPAKFYKCIKEPSYKEGDVNMFISYVFTGTSSNDATNATTSFFQRNPRFTLGRIYHTVYFSDEYIIDDLGTSRKLLDAMPYLEPYELVIDELSQKVINNKMLIKGDEIEIQPSKEYEDYTSYLISVSALDKNGRRITAQTYSSSIYDGLVICYRRLRTRNDNYCMFYSLIHNKVYPIIKRRRKKLK